MQNKKHLFRFSLITEFSCGPSAYGRAVQIDGCLLVIPHVKYYQGYESCFKAGYGKVVDILRNGPVVRYGILHALFQALNKLLSIETPECRPIFPLRASVRLHELHEAHQCHVRHKLLPFPGAQSVSFVFSFHAISSLVFVCGAV